MKRTFLLLILLLVASFARANEIDKVKTAKDIEQLLSNKQDSTGHNLSITENDIKAFYKMDIDSNGLTDLVINGIYCYAIMDMGNGHYEHMGIHTNMGYNALGTLQTKDGSLLTVRRYEQGMGPLLPNRANDTLICKFGGFIEYNPNPGQEKVEEINVAFSPGNDVSGGYFDLKISTDRKMKYTYETADSMAIMDASSFNRLIQTINYLNINSLNDIYSWEATDDVTMQIQVRFSNGKVKKIRDYGARGTFGLQNLYRQLYQAMDAAHWEKY